MGNNYQGLPRSVVAFLLLTAWAAISAAASPIEDLGNLITPSTKLVRIKQKSTDVPIPDVRVSCKSSNRTTAVQNSQTLEPGDVFQLYPVDLPVSCTFIWMGSDHLVGSQHFVVFAPDDAPDVLMLPFYCRLCVWVFDHSGFDLYENTTDSFVRVHNWLIGSS